MAKGWTVEANLVQFNRALDQYGEKFEVQHGELIMWASLTTVGMIEKTTPVRTGRARAAWLPFLWSHNKQAVLISATNMGLSPVKVRAAQSEGLRRGKHRSKFKGAKPYAWITNAVNYIVYLEYGVRRGAQKAVAIEKARLSSASKRYPSGFVRRALKTMRMELKRKTKQKAG